MVQVLVVTGLTEKLQQLIVEGVELSMLLRLGWVSSSLLCLSALFLLNFVMAGFQPLPSGSQGSNFIADPKPQARIANLREWIQLSVVPQ